MNKFEEKPEKTPGTKPADQDINIETELSPEDIETIMSKIRDINEAGTGVYGISARTSIRNMFRSYERDVQIIASFFHNGILPERLGSHGSMMKTHKNDDPQNLPAVQSEYAEQEKKYQRRDDTGFATFNYLNVIGRSLTGFNYDQEVTVDGIKPSKAVSELMYTEGVSLLIDVDKLDKRQRIGRAGSDSGGRGGPGYNKKVGHYKGKEAKTGWKRLEYGSMSHGYAVENRIPPRLMTGLVVHKDKDTLTQPQIASLNELEELKHKREKEDKDRDRINELYKQLYEEGVLTFDENNKRPLYDNYNNLVVNGISNETEDDESKMNSWIEPIVKEMIRGAGDHKDRIVPVYDIEGNLLWPKKISHDEILELVRENSGEQTELPPYAREIWLVDDNPDISRSTARYLAHRLKNSDYTVKTFSTAQEAKDELIKRGSEGKGSPSYILMDGELDLDKGELQSGAGAIEAIKALASIRMPEFIAFTADKASKEKMAALGALNEFEKGDIGKISTYIIEKFEKGEK